MLVDSIKMGFNDLRKRKFRTALTAFSIAIGTMLLVIMFGLGEGIEKLYTDKLNSLSTFKIVTVDNKEPNKEVKDKNGNATTQQGKFKKIDGTTIDNMKKISGVSSVIAETKSQLTGTKISDSTGKKVEIVGRDTNYPLFGDALINDAKKKDKKNYEPIIAGKTLEKGDNTSVLVGQKYLEKIGITDYKTVIGKEIELKVEIPAINGQQVKEPLIMKAKIVGIINKNYEEGYSVVAPIATASKVKEYYTGEKDYLNTKGYDKLNVECKSLDNVKTVNSEISSKLGYNSSASLEMAEQMTKSFGVIKVILIIAGVIVLLVSAIGVINTMTMTVYEKTKSIGIMKAQGASRGHINVMFLVQSGVLGFIGGIVGCVLSFVVALGLDSIIISKLTTKGVTDINKLFYTPLWAMAAATGFSIFICLIAGIIPAKRAAKLNPVDSLRYE